MTISDVLQQQKFNHNHIIQHQHEQYSQHMQQQQQINKAIIHNEVYNTIAIIFLVKIKMKI